MGKILSRFKFGRSVNSKYQNKKSYHTEPDFDDIQHVSSPPYNQPNCANMTNLPPKRLHEINNLPEYENILNVNCSTNNSICMFGQSDYVILFY